MSLIVTKLLCVFLVFIDCSDSSVFPASRNLFKNVNDKTFIQVKANEQLAIPCRPASPNYHVTLTKNGQKINESDNIEFDSEIGFTIKQVKLLDHYGSFTCKITENNHTQEISYNVMVLRTFALNKPVINEKPLQYVVEGQTLRVNCSVDIEKDTPVFYNFGWIKSSHNNKNNPRISSKKYRLNYSKFSNDFNDVCELIINNVTYNDEGEYQCKIVSLMSVETTTMKLIVNDPSNFFINLTTRSNHYEIHEGKDVQWVVEINAYPQPKISWFHYKQSTYPLSNSEKYMILNDQYTSIFQIKNLTKKDGGFYKIKVEIPDSKIEERLYFSLKVLDKK